MLADFQQTVRRPTGPIATMDRTKSVQKRLHPTTNLNRLGVESMSIPNIGPEIFIPGSDGNLQEVQPLLDADLQIRAITAAFHCQPGLPLE